MKRGQRLRRNGSDQGESHVGQDHPLRGCSLTDVWTQPRFQGIVKGMILLLCGRPTSRNRVGLSFARLNPLEERPRCTRTSQGELDTPLYPYRTSGPLDADPPPSGFVTRPPPHSLTSTARLEGGQTKSPTPEGVRLVCPAGLAQGQGRV